MGEAIVSRGSCVVSDVTGVVSGRGEAIVTCGRAGPTPDRAPDK